MEDDFDGQFGVLQSRYGGTGARRALTAQHTLTPGGLEYQLHCLSCGHRNGVVLEWPELILAGEGLIPPGWAHDPSTRALVPQVPCILCNNREGPGLAIRVFPNECQRAVQAGLQNRYIQPQQVHELLARVRGQAR